MDRLLKLYITHHSEIPLATGHNISQGESLVLKKYFFKNKTWKEKGPYYIMFAF